MSLPTLTKRLAAVLLPLAVIGSLALPYRPGRVQAPQIDITPADYRSLPAVLSEPEGYFDTDNFISNETSYLHVAAGIRLHVPHGHVYLGVGPDQNFAYILHSRPSVAFIVDIRRQNQLQHYWYRALFELAPDRTAYLSRMFGRVNPGHAPGSSLKDILSRVRQAPAPTELHAAYSAEAEQLLTGTLGLNLSADDLERIRYVSAAFRRAGPDLRFSSFGRSGAGYPTIEELLLETDLEGREAGYLTSDEDFAWLREFQRSNRIIPLTGDFAGTTAFRKLAEYLRQRGLEVGLFYTSNVEYYLFGDRLWNRYLENVRALPRTSGAFFIRSYFRMGPPHPQQQPGHRPVSLLQPIADTLDQASRGGIRSYWDLVKGKSWQ